VYAGGFPGLLNALSQSIMILYLHEQTRHQYREETRNSIAIRLQVHAIIPIHIEPWKDPYVLRDRVSVDMNFQHDLHAQLTHDEAIRLIYNIQSGRLTPPLDEPRTRNNHFGKRYTLGRGTAFLLQPCVGKF
jgi:hypothetical protein